MRPVLTILCFAVASTGFAQQDPPSRVARLSYMAGGVSMRPAEAPDWLTAELNRPFTSGDYLYTDVDSRAELHSDVAVMRMGPRTNFGFETLNDQAMQIRLSDGDFQVRIHDLNGGETIEIDTPNAKVLLLRDGLYRFRVDRNGAFSFLVVRQGTAEVSGGGQAVTVNPGSSMLISGADHATFDLQRAPGDDDFDRWCRERDEREAHAISARYVPPTLVGYEDLDSNGSWDAETAYGPVWYPRAMPSGWAPYRFGHWAFIAPWGWTWVDDASWGFAPFHYGRWVFVTGRWGWCPGPVVVARQAAYYGPPPRPHYAPALVAWLGGAHFGVSLSLGGGAPNVGWVPLGVGEIYTPPYHCSPHYFNNVNVNNTRVTNNVNITNVYNTVYVNKTVYNQNYVHVNSPNAVAAMRQDQFAGGRPVRSAGVALQREQITQMQPAAAVVTAPPVNRPAFRSREAFPNGQRPAQPPVAQTQTQSQPMTRDEFRGQRDKSDRPAAMERMQQQHRPRDYPVRPPQDMRQEEHVRPQQQHRAEEHREHEREHKENK